jgi:hypothetical protein
VVFFPRLTWGSAVLVFFLKNRHLGPKAAAFLMTGYDFSLEAGPLSSEFRDRCLELGGVLVIRLRFSLPGVAATHQLPLPFLEGIQLLTTGNRFRFPLT